MEGAIVARPCRSPPLTSLSFSGRIAAVSAPIRPRNERVIRIGASGGRADQQCDGAPVGGARSDDRAIGKHGGTGLAGPDRARPLNRRCCGRCDPGGPTVLDCTLERSLVGRTVVGCLVGRTAVGCVVGRTVVGRVVGRTAVGRRSPIGRTAVGVTGRTVVGRVGGRGACRPTSRCRGIRTRRSARPAAAREPTAPAAAGASRSASPRRTPRRCPPRRRPSRARGGRCARGRVRQREGRTRWGRCRPTRCPRSASHVNAHGLFQPSLITTGA